MTALPTGTVTFLFTDIEGSTRLLDELGDEYADVLAEHHRLMRAAFKPRGGVEVDTAGDAFFVAFERASDAVAAAAGAQEALVPTGLRVRMGIHTGQPLLTETGYVGMDVHQGARIMSAGHGGQVLVSDETHALLDGDPRLVDVGAHRLKDLTEPQRLWQLGDGEFPPLKTLYQSNLPIQPTALVGRESELAEILKLLAEARLVTLTGAGGSGKTRLALQAAAELVDEFKDGVWWVSLAALRDPELVESTIAQVVGAKEGLVEHLRSKQTLLLLDNFEQLLEAATLIAGLLAESPGLRLLVTSRERLGIAAEQEYAVPTMVPTEAIALFTARARQLQPDFQPGSAVGEICARLDGLPLAIELAAARIKVLRPDQILERLGQSLDLLTTGARDAPERHQTLRATIQWSHDLLEDGERQLFGHLAVFAGSFDLDAADAVCDADLDALAALVDKSLLRRTDEARFFMLDTIREFATELGDQGKTRHVHAQYFLSLAEQGRLDSRHDPEKVTLVERDEDNFRVALDWFLGSGMAEDALRMCVGLALFWDVRDRLIEGSTKFAEALRLPGEVERELRARALLRFGALSAHSDELGESKRAYDESLAIAEEADNAQLVAEALTGLAMHSFLVEADDKSATELLEQALAIFQEVGHVEGERRSLHLLGEFARDRGERERAAELLGRSADLSRVAGDEIFESATLHSLGDLALDERDLDWAEDRFRESLRLARKAGFAGHVALCLAGISSVAMGRGDQARAARLWSAVQRYESERGVKLHAHERARYERLLAGLEGCAPGEAADLDAVAAEELSDDV